MARLGFIHDKLDIKFLVLYLTARTAAPIDLPTLTDLALCDEGVDYFLLTQAVAELVESEHLLLEHERYSITEKGRKNGAVWEESLPFSVRQKCDGNLAKLNDKLRQEAQIRAEVLERSEGGFIVRMALDDSAGSLMALELYSPTRENAQQLAAAFREDPQKLYRAVLASLWEGQAPSAKE